MGVQLKPKDNVFEELQETFQEYQASIMAQGRLDDLRKASDVAYSKFSAAQEEFKPFFKQNEFEQPDFESERNAVQRAYANKREEIQSEYYSNLQNKEAENQSIRERMEKSQAEFVNQMSAERQRLNQSLELDEARYKQQQTLLEKKKAEEEELYRSRYEERSRELEQQMQSLGNAEADKELLRFAQQEQEIRARYDAERKKQKEEYTAGCAEREKKMASLQSQLSKMRNQYSANIQELQKSMASINQKYSAVIQREEQNVREAKNDREELIKLIKQQEQGVTREENEKINNLVKLRTDTERSFIKQIRQKAEEGGPTAQLEISKNSQLRKLTEQIATAENAKVNRLQKYNADANMQIEQMNQKLARCEQKHQEVLNNYHREADPVQNKLEQVCTEADETLKKLQAEIKEEQELAFREDMNNGDTYAFIKRQEDTELNKIYQQKVEYAMRGKDTYSRMLAEAQKPFRELTPKLEVWKNVMNAMASGFLEKELKRMLDYNVQIIDCSNYQQLLNLRNSSIDLPEQPDKIASNARKLIAGMGGVAVALIFLFIFAFHFPVILGILLPVVAWAVGVTCLRNHCREIMNRYQRVYYMIANYGELRGIKSAAYNEAGKIDLKDLEKRQESVMAEMSNIEHKRANIGQQIRQCSEEYQRKLQELQSKFATETQRLYREYMESRAAKEGMFEKKKEQLETDARASKSLLDKINNEKMNIQKQYQQQMEEIRNAENKSLDDLEAQRISFEKCRTNYNRAKENYEICRQKYQEAEEDIQRYRRHHAELKEKLKSTYASEQETEYVLRERIWLLPGFQIGEDKQSSQREDIVEVKHDQRPFLILYDGKDIPNDRLGKLIDEILFDFLYAFRWVNTPDVCRQYIIDPISGGAKFQSDERKQELLITEVCRSIHDSRQMRDYLEKIDFVKGKLQREGITIDAFNKRQYENGTEPYKYHIVYVVIEADNESNAVPDELEKLLPRNYEFGLLPVFICDKTKWETKKDSDNYVYKKIRNYVENRVFLYNEGSYEEMTG